MRTVLLQQDVCLGNTAENVRRADDAITCAGSADLYVLPEMFSTGFVTEPAGFAEPADGSTLRWMQWKARSTGSALCGSIVVEDGGNYFNRFYFVHPDGSMHSYDKRHLFAYGGESLRYTCGQQRVVVSHCGVRILLQICYDLRFPVFSRNGGGDVYDMIIYVANWPESRIDAWNTLLRARAIENQCYVAGVNRVGDDSSCHYSGGTALIDPYGRVAARCDDGIQMSVGAVVDMDSLVAFRRKFPVLDDADVFRIMTDE